MHRVQGTFGRTDFRFEDAVLFVLYVPRDPFIHWKLDDSITLYSAIVVAELGSEACEVFIYR